MTLLIADTFTAALARLTGPEQTAAKTAAMDLQIDPSHPALQLHRVDRARDRNFWTARASRDIRLVLHKRGTTTLLAWVGHHDDAYDWAETRRIDTHPATGAAQIVEIRETVEEVVSRRYVEAAREAPKVLADFSEADLLSWGVPSDWLATVRDATEATLLDIAARLPAEAGEALLVAATGGIPTLPVVPDLAAAEGTVEEAFTHPDALRRFRVIGDQAELEAALDAPWERWAIFLHPAQREFVTRDFNGPARVIGSAGTGKTVVALHRAVRLGREGGRVLLATFNAALAEALRRKLMLLVGGDRALIALIEVRDMERAGVELHERLLGPVCLATSLDVRSAVASAAAREADSGFFQDEWRLVVDAWGVTSAETYRDLPRRGRRQRVAASRRDAVWSVFDRVRSDLSGQGLTTRAGMFHRLADHFTVHPAPWDHVVVDEAQDISVAELRFLAAVAGGRPNGLFFAGDIGQRIFRQAFPWSELGVDVRGRSRSLKVNYRTSRQIRERSDRLLPSRLTESDGSEEDRRGVVSVFEGPGPEFCGFPNSEAEISAAGAWLREVALTVAPQEIAVLVRSVEEYGRARAALEEARLEHVELVGGQGQRAGCAVLATMHQAKGSEFRAVAVMACDAAVLPSESRLMSAIDEASLDEVFATERHLLYVAATRARDRLWVSGVIPVSEFVTDLVV